MSLTVAVCCASFAADSLDGEEGVSVLSQRDHTQHTHDGGVRRAALDGFEPDASAFKNIGIAFALTLIYAVVELVGGVAAGSTAIISAALHAIGDSITLALAWLLERIALRRSNAHYSYGYRRFSLLSAVLSGIIIVVGSVWILLHIIPDLIGIEIFAGGEREQHGHDHSPHSGGMFALALLGIAVNVAAALVLKQGRTANEKMLIWRMIAHILSWVSILVVAVVLMFFDLPLLDPILSVCIIVFILHVVGTNLWGAIKLFLQAVPHGVDLGDLYTEVKKRVAGVVDMHDVRIWSLDGTSHVFSSHVVVEENTSIDKMTEIKHSIRDILAELGAGKFYTTIEFESSSEICLAKVWGKN